MEEAELRVGAGPEQGSVSPPKSEHRLHRAELEPNIPEALPRLPEPSVQGILAAGSRFGGYIVGACIGQGGMARIYRAEHEGLRRHVALKVLTDGFADKDARERFLREARMAASIKHPNVVNIFDVGVHNGVPYLVMELLEGEDLEALLQSRGALDEGTIIDVIVPVVAGLMAVHESGVVHRDLKPGNIFLTRGRNDEVEPKLLDFGISKADGPDALNTTASNGLLMGTPFYISPEAVRGKDVNALSDQYSIGVVLYECAAGFNPFTANTFAEVVHRVTTGNFVPPSQHCPRISKRLSRIIERAMSLEPEQRFSDLSQLGRELLVMAGQRTRITWGLTFGVDSAFAGNADADTFEDATAQGTRSAQKRRRWPAIAVGLGALAAVAAAVVVGVTGMARDGGAQAKLAGAVPGLSMAVSEPAQLARAGSKPAAAAISRSPLSGEPSPGEQGQPAGVAARQAEPGLLLVGNAAAVDTGAGSTSSEPSLDKVNAKSEGQSAVKDARRRQSAQASSDSATASATRSQSVRTRKSESTAAASAAALSPTSPVAGTNNSPILD